MIYHGKTKNFLAMYYKIKKGSPTGETIKALSDRIGEILDNIKGLAAKHGFSKYGAPAFCVKGIEVAIPDNPDAKLWSKADDECYMRPNMRTKAGKALAAEMEACGSLDYADICRGAGLNAPSVFDTPAVRFEANPDYYGVRLTERLYNDNKGILPADYEEITVTQYENLFNGDD